MKKKDLQALLLLQQGLIHKQQQDLTTLGATAAYMSSELDRWLPHFHFSRDIVEFFAVATNCDFAFDLDTFFHGTYQVHCEKHATWSELVHVVLADGNYSIKFTNWKRNKNTVRWILCDLEHVTESLVWTSHSHAHKLLGELKTGFLTKYFHSASGAPSGNYKVARDFYNLCKQQLE